MSGSPVREFVQTLCPFGALTIGIGLLGAICCRAADSALAFDAASVKLVEDKQSCYSLPRKVLGGPGTASPGRFTATAVSLQRLVRRAWDLPDFQVSGPSWMDGFAPCYMVSATMPPETTKEQFQKMLQTLLTERFQIRTHYEERRGAGFDLTVAPGGSKLKPAADPDAPEPETGSPGGVDKDGFGLLPRGHGVAIVMANGMRAKFQNYTLAEFTEGNYLRSWAAEAARTDLGPIRDKTGLKGMYDFTLAFDNRRAASLRVAGGESRTVSSPDPTGLPNVFGALERQLGLRLVPVKDIQFKALIIDEVKQTPTPD